MSMNKKIFHYERHAKKGMLVKGEEKIVEGEEKAWKIGL